MKTYWHFINKNRRLSYGDKRLVEVGKTLTVDCDPILGERGLHASERLLDALNYASGLTLCKVTLGGVIIKGDDNVVGTERTVIAIADVTDIVKQWSKRVALDVVHLWDAPQVVLEFLNGDDTRAEEAERVACVASVANAAAKAVSAAWSARAAWSACETARSVSAASAAWSVSAARAAWSAWSACEAARSASAARAASAAMNKYSDWLEEMVEQATGEIAE